MITPRKERPSDTVRSLSPEEEASIERVLDADSTPNQKKQTETIHDSLVNDAMELVAAIFKARSGREPDAAYLAEMRKIYSLKGDERLREETDKLIVELNLISKN